MESYPLGQSRQLHWAQHGLVKSSKWSYSSSPQSKIQDADKQEAAHAGGQGPTGRQCSRVRRGAVDAWGLGCLIQEVYRGSPLTRTEELRDTSSIPKNILPGWAIPSSGLS